MGIQKVENHSADRSVGAAEKGRERIHSLKTGWTSDLIDFRDPHSFVTLWNRHRKMSLQCVLFSRPCIPDILGFRCLPLPSHSIFFNHGHKSPPWYLFFSYLSSNFRSAPRASLVLPWCERFV